ncbi:MAG TPA: hypothetical protein VFR38_18400 [Gaiellaceae bacterium]|nr:hypothetical protein [Gaiellaceae bacterium]
MAQEAAPATTPIPDPLETLTRELQLKISEVLASRSSEYDQGVLAGLTIAGELVEREQRRLREIDEEHVPGRVYGPRGQA